MHLDGALVTKALELRKVTATHDPEAEQIAFALITSESLRLEEIHTSVERVLEAAGHRPAEKRSASPRGRFLDRGATDGLR